MKLMCDSYLLETDSMGSPGLENVKWLKPVRPNDTLEVFRTILESRKSLTKKNLGILTSIGRIFKFNLASKSFTATTKQSQGLMVAKLLPTEKIVSCCSFQRNLFYQGAS